MAPSARSEGVVASLAGDRLATTICQTGVDFVGGCDPTEVIDIATGNVVTSIELNGAFPEAMSGHGVLASSLDHVEFLDFHGARLWASPSFTGSKQLWNGRLIDARTALLEVHIHGEDPKVQYLVADVLTGSTRTVATIITRRWIYLATPEILILTDRSECSGPCGPLHRTLDGSTIDLATGSVDRDAIHITFTE